MEDKQIDSEAPIADNTKSQDGAFQEGIAYQQSPAIDGALDVAVEGYEGPLHVLLNLARTQKVDLKQISILQLAEQYLDFIR